MSERERAPVSVIVPTRAQGPLLGRAIASLCLQKTLPSELVLVDDSSDGAAGELLRRGCNALPFEVTVLSGQGRGPGAARNRGAEAANYPLLAFLDDDDVWFPDKLAEQIPILVDGTVLVGAQFSYVTYDGKVVGRSDRYTDRAAAREDLLAARELPVQTSTWLLRATDFASSGGFDETMLRAQDLEFACRFIRHGRLDWPETGPLVAYVLRGGSETSERYQDQFLAAELTRRRVREDWTADPRWTYDSFVAHRQGLHELSPSIRRRMVSGVHYRRAAVAYGEGRLLYCVAQLAAAVAAHPSATLTKLGWQKPIASRREALPPAVLKLFREA